MVFIGRKSAPSKGLGQRIIAGLIVLVMLFMSTTMFINIDSFRYNEYNLLNNTTAIMIEQQYDRISIADIAKEKIQEYENIGEITNWSFDKDKFFSSQITVTLDKNKNTDLKEKIKNCINLSFNQYELKIDDNNTTFYFKSEQDAQNYKEKISASADIIKTTVGELNITSQADLDNKYVELTKPVVVAKVDIPQVTSRGGTWRNESSIYSGILPLESYVYISSYYRTKSRPNHTGVDYAAYYGTEIKAFQSGTVIRASWYGNYGNCIEISHNNGLVTRYAHCSGYNVSVGDYVNQGDTIGFVGSTGKSTGNHLHFETIINGTFYNPLNYIK